MTMIRHQDMLQLKRWNTPSVYNGWERITRRDRIQGLFNREELRDFMPEMGPMVGRALTVVFEPSNPAHQRTFAERKEAYLRYLARDPGPRIVVLQDLDKPAVLASYWGEVNANLHKAFGCVGTITDGAIRDLAEMKNAGVKDLARRLCVGHASACPVRWDCEVEVFGCRIQPGQLIHADQHGFLAIPEDEEEALLEAARFMDEIECRHKLPVTRDSSGLTREQLVKAIMAEDADFERAAQQKFGC
jgi:4-hydroxy-4-methyl-2-oxoglutarate aldolase